MANQRTFLIFTLQILALGVAVSIGAQQVGFVPSQGSGEELEVRPKQEGRSRKGKFPAGTAAAPIQTRPGTPATSFVPIPQTDRSQYIPFHRTGPMVPLVRPSQFALPGRNALSQPPPAGNRLVPKNRFGPGPKAQLPRPLLDNDSPRPGATVPRPSISLLASQSATLTIGVHGLSEVKLGAPADYELVVTNPGPSVAEGVIVRAELPGGCKLLFSDMPPASSSSAPQWHVGTMEPGSERRIRIQLQPAGRGEFHFRAVVSCTTSCDVRTAIAQRELQLVVTAPPTATIGDVVPLLFKIMNPGIADATNVILRTQLPEGLEHPAGRDIEYEVGTLPAGQSFEIPLNVTVRQTGRQFHSVEVTADGGLKSMANAVVQVLEPKLVLENTGPKRRYVARPATYSILVRNPSGSKVSNVVIDEQLPDGMVVLAASEGGRPGPEKNHVRWAIGDLPAGESRSVSVTVRCEKPGEFTSRALVSSEGKLRAQAAAHTVVEGIPVLLLEVVDLDDPIETGADTVYEIRVINQGSAAATNLVISAVAPEGIRLLKADGPSQAQIQGQQVTFAPLPRLASRADAGYFVHVRGLSPGDLRFRVQLQCDHLEAPVNAEESTRVYTD